MTQQILIVGAGILGLSHAYAAAKRGLKVRVFERTGTPLGASVRNFGQALVTGQPPGVMLDLARAVVAAELGKPDRARQERVIAVHGELVRIAGQVATYNFDPALLVLEIGALLASLAMPREAAA